MIKGEVKIGDKVIGLAIIDTDDGKHTEIEVWISKALLRIALGSECNVIHCDV